MVYTRRYILHNAKEFKGFGTIELAQWIFKVNWSEILMQLPHLTLQIAQKSKHIEVPRLICTCIPWKAKFFHVSMSIFIYCRYLEKRNFPSPRLVRKRRSKFINHHFRVRDPWWNIISKEVKRDAHTLLTSMVYHSTHDCCRNTTAVILWYSSQVYFPTVTQSGLGKIRKITYNRNSNAEVNLFQPLLIK